MPKMKRKTRKKAPIMVRLTEALLSRLVKGVMAVLVVFLNVLLSFPRFLIRLLARPAQKSSTHKTESRSKRAKAKQPKTPSRALPHGVKLMALAIFVVGLVAVFVASPLGGRVLNGAWVMLDDALVFAGVRVDDVTVEGRQRTDRDALIRALRVTEQGTILRIDLEAMATRIEALPWVASVRVERRLPDIVHIALTERAPFALKREGNQLILFDATGAPIIGMASAEFAFLPIFEGADSEHHAAELMTLLQAYPILHNRLVVARWVGQRRWDIRLDTGSLIMLPEEAAANALDRLMGLERMRRILAMEDQVIDLRLPDRVVLRALEGRQI